MKNQNKTYKRIVFPGVENNVIENPAYIMFCKADDHYIDIYFKNGNQMCQAVCLKYIVAKIDPSVFIRCHKSYIINMEYVKNYWYHERYIVVKMGDANQIPVSVNYVRAFEGMLRIYTNITRV